MRARTSVQARTKHLEEESSRRANVFNNAVKTSVERIQSSLQDERDSLATKVLEHRLVIALAAPGPSSSLYQYSLRLPLAPWSGDFSGGGTSD